MNQMDLSWVQRFEHDYRLRTIGVPILLNQRQGQQVYRVEVEEEHDLTVRLCSSERPLWKVQAGAFCLAFLNQAAFPAPTIHLTFNKEQTFQWQDECWGYVHIFIPGKKVVMDLLVLEKLAVLLAKLHLLARSKKQFPVEVNWLAELPGSIERAAAYTSNPLWGEKALEVENTLRTLPDLSGLPIGLIHTDVHEGNLLFNSQDELYLLDWEDAGLGQMVFDLALVLGWNCVWPSEKDLRGRPTLYDFDEEWCCTFLTAYQSLRKLSEAEGRNLGAAIRFVMGWFAARDIARETTEPGVSEGLAFTNWAIMRSVTPDYEEVLAKWANETSFIP